MSGGCHDICDQQVENPRKDEGPCDRGVFTESGEGAPAEPGAREEGVVRRIARGAKVTLPAEVDVENIRKRLKMTAVALLRCLRLQPGWGEALGGWTAHSLGFGASFSDGDRAGIPMQ